MSHRVLYRIHTENKPNLWALVGAYFDGFNILVGTGFWKNEREESATIEIMCDVEDRGRVFEAARSIREINRQEVVYVSAMPITLTEVHAPFPINVVSGTVDAALLGS